NQVKSRIGHSQRELFLSEQLRVIEEELGIGSDDSMELEELRQQIEAAEMPEEARARADKELDRLARMAPMSPEATVVRSYLECLVEVPWAARTTDRIELKLAQEILD